MTGSNRFKVGYILLVLLASSCDEKRAATTEQDAVQELRELSELYRYRQSARLNLDSVFDQMNDDVVKAMSAAKAGRFESALTASRSARTLFHTALRDHLRREFVEPATKRLSQEPNLPKAVRDRAERRLVEVNVLLADLETEDDLTPATLDAVLSRLALVDLGLAGKLSRDVNPACTEATPFELAELTIATAPNSERLGHDDIHYTTTGEIDVSMDISVCARIDQVRLDTGFTTLQLGTDAESSDPIEGGGAVPHYYEILATKDLGTGTQTVQLRLHVPDYDDGRSFHVAIRVSSLPSGFSRTREFTWVLVDAIGTNPTLSISENEMRDMFLLGFYETYGDAGKHKVEVNNFPDITLTRPAYDELATLIGVDGVHLRFKTEVQIPRFCDLEANVKGLFTFELVNGSVEVEWKSGPNADFKLPVVCEVALGAALGIIKQVLLDTVAEARFADEVRDLIQQEIDDALGENSAFVFLERIQTRVGEVVVEFRIVADSVSMIIPFGTRRVEEVWGRGTALNPSEQVLISANGLVDACFNDGQLPNSCTRRQASPAGLFNWNLQDPMPNPWPITDLGTVAYFKERHKVWVELSGFRRKQSKLPFPNANVGALVARAGSKDLSSNPILASDVCWTEVGDGAEEYRIAFGANDYRYLGVSEFGSGDQRVILTWVDQSITELAPRCATQPTSLSAIVEELDTLIALEP